MTTHNRPPGPYWVRTPEMADYEPLLPGVLSHDGLAWVVWVAGFDRAHLADDITEWGEACQDVPSPPTITWEQVQFWEGKRRMKVVDPPWWARYGPWRLDVDPVRPFGTDRIVGYEWVVQVAEPDGDEDAVWAEHRVPQHPTYRGTIPRGDAQGLAWAKREAESALSCAIAPR